MPLNVHLSIGKIAHSYNGMHFSVPLGPLDDLDNWWLRVYIGPLCIEYDGRDGITCETGIACVAERLTGFQGGGLCYAEEEMTGLQIGGFCYAGDGDVLQIGGITARGNGPWYTRLTPFIGWHRKGTDSNGLAEETV